MSVPIQGVVTMRLSATTSPTTLPLVTQAVVMGLGTLIWPLVFRVAEDKGRPLSELYGFRMGIFLTVWAVLGGFIGTDPWYEVLHGHFAFNTDAQPQWRAAVHAADDDQRVRFLQRHPRHPVPGDHPAAGPHQHRCGRATRWWRHGVLCAVLAVPMPLGETFAYSGSNYCFDNGIGMWGLNVLIYGGLAFRLAAVLHPFRHPPGTSEPR